MPASSPLSQLLGIMARLRDPDGGCAWDLAQSFETIAPYTIEEAYEVRDAIQRQDIAALKDELGDLLLQVVFHARMAEEQGLFSFDDVAQAIADKMERRHPHIFGATVSDGLAADTVKRRWEELKADERQASGATSQLDGVALALPALVRAEKIQKRAARVGFDWPDVTGAVAKSVEELAELEAAQTMAEKQDEFGDLLFSLVNVGRHLNIDAETALEQATSKFERRFRHMEAQAADAGLEALSLDALDDLWRQAKSTVG